MTQGRIQFYPDVFALTISAVAHSRWMTFLQRSTQTGKVVFIPAKTNSHFPVACVTGFAFLEPHFSSFDVPLLWNLFKCPVDPPLIQQQPNNNNNNNNNNNKNIDHRIKTENNKTIKITAARSRSVTLYGSRCGWTT